MNRFTALLMLVVVLAAAGCAGPTTPRRAPTPLPSAAPPPPAAPARPSALRDFPWPPPEPSAHTVLEDALFHVGGKPAATMRVVGSRLEKALNQSGYEYSYYRVTNGFALVARLERIREDGTPQPEEFRFLSPGASEPFSLATYIKQLFFAPTGFYRMIVFVATDQSITAWAPTLGAKQAERLVRGGASGLTADIERSAWTQDHSVTALIYEFRKVARDSEPTSVRPSRLSAHTHLERAKIRTALTAPQ